MGNVLDRQIIVYAAYAHGLFNICVAALFCYQAWTGLRIRRARRSGRPVPFAWVRRHRKSGPVFAVWAVIGYAAGLIIAVLDKGKVVAFPLHFILGTVLIGVIGTVYAASRRIAGAATPARDLHLLLGGLALTLYAGQILVGLSIIL